MPSPISPSSLLELVPPRNGSFCGRFIPGIINWMQARADFYRWMYKDNGDLTVSFITDICIARNGTVIPDPETCPPIAVSSSILTRSEELELTFTATAAAGYAYSLYRATAVTGPWGSAITSGTVATSGVVEYTDSALTNDTAYFYKFTVQKAGCPIVSFQTTGTPQLCMGFDFQLTVTSLAPGAISVKAANVYPDYPMDNSFTYEILVNGVLVDSGAIGGSPCTLNGGAGLCKVLTGLDAGPNSVATVNIAEKVGCAAKSQSTFVGILGTQLHPPTVYVVGGRIIISPGAGGVPASFILIRRSAGLCSEGGLLRQFSIPYNPGSVNGIYMDRANWPCTENVLQGGSGTVNPRCKQKYSIWAHTVATDGGVSEASGVIVVDYPQVPLLTGHC